MALKEESTTGWAETFGGQLGAVWDFSRLRWVLLIWEYKLNATGQAFCFDGLHIMF